MPDSYWTTIIKPLTGWFDVSLKDVWRYRDLAFMFAKRNFTVVYKQTILGPIWILLNPFLTSVIFTVIFGYIAQIPTDGVPSMLFYLAGYTLWGMFASCITNTANTFTANAGVLGKVYFPRLIMPISAVMTAVVNFFIQFAMFLCFLSYYMIKGSVAPQLQYIWLLPLILLELCMLGLGVGIIVSSLTTKYRDLAIAVTFCVQLWMYATPIVYPMSQISGRFETLIMCNPVAPCIEIFRYVMLGAGEIPWGWWGISAAVSALLLAVGVLLFSRVEKTFMDTV